MKSQNGEKTLADWRGEIDALDSELLRLLNRRASIACEVALVKVAAQLPAYDQRREIQVLDRVAAQNQGPFPPESVLHIFRSIIRETRRLGTRTMQAQSGASRFKVSSFSKSSSSKSSRTQGIRSKSTGSNSSKENSNGNQHGKWRNGSGAATRD